MPEKQKQPPLKTKEGEMREFKRVYAGEYAELGEDIYLLHAKPEDLKKKELKKALVILPYCLKPLKCKYRLEYECDWKNCQDCVIGPICKYMAENGVDYNFVIYDDTDIPKHILKHKKKFGKIDLGIIILCPHAVIENKRFVDYHKEVPIITFFIEDFMDCEFSKATQGKFWGKTNFEFGKFKRTLEALVGRGHKGNPAAPQQEGAGKDLT